MSVTKMTIRLNDEAIKKLDEVIATKYKGRGSKVDVIRWLIEDSWEAEVKKVEDKVA